MEPRLVLGLFYILFRSTRGGILTLLPVNGLICDFALCFILNGSNWLNINLTKMETCHLGRKFHKSYLYCLQSSNIFMYIHIFF